MPASQFPDHDRRKMTHILIRPKSQLRFTFTFLGACVSSLIVMMVYVFFAVEQAVLQAAKDLALAPEVTAGLQSELHFALWVVMAITAPVALFTFFAGLRMTHKIYGPLVPILRQVERLNAGDYGARMSLRQTDELTEIRDALNGLADSLEKRHTH